MREYSTGQVAKICQVKKDTVRRWFDKGRLEGRRLPGSGHRRIPRECLIKFLRERGMPLASLGNPFAVKILVISENEKLFRAFRKKLSTDAGVPFDSRIVKDAWAGGMQFGEFFPDFVVVDFAIGESEARKICQNLRNMKGYSPVMILAVLPEDNSVSFDRSKVTETLRCPLQPETLIARICELYEEGLQQKT